MGLPGATRECVDAIMRLIETGADIAGVQLVSHDNEHALFITLRDGDLVAIKSGFTSGYGGEGPEGLSYVLTLLEFHEITIDEYAVSAELLERLDSGALTVANVRSLTEARPIRPRRWRSYIDPQHRQMAEAGQLWTRFGLHLPLAIIEPRLVDLAKVFWNDPDKALLSAYRRLEDQVRSRTRNRESGAKLFSQAFAGDNPKLAWKGIDSSEQAGRANLFTGAYMAYRNPRAHREPKENAVQHLSEFLMLNHLFALERQAEKPRGRGAHKRKAAP